MGVNRAPGLSWAAGTVGAGELLSPRVILSAGMILRNGFRLREPAAVLSRCMSNLKRYGTVVDEVGGENFAKANTELT